jgi:DNA-binding XRE family transcriptional regulator
MTRETSAKYIGVGCQTIVALAPDYYTPSLEDAMRLAGIFSLEVDDIFFLKTVEAPPLHLKGSK